MKVFPALIATLVTVVQMGLAMASPIPCDLVFEKNVDVTPEGVLKVLCAVPETSQAEICDAKGVCKTHACPRARLLSEKPEEGNLRGGAVEDADRKLPHSWCKFFCKPSGGYVPSALWCSYNCPCFRRSLSDLWTRSPAVSEVDYLQASKDTLDLVKDVSDTGFDVAETVDVFCHA